MRFHLIKYGTLEALDTMCGAPYYHSTCGIIPLAVVRGIATSFFKQGSW